MTPLEARACPTSSRIPAAAQRLDAPVALAPDQCVVCSTTSPRLPTPATGVAAGTRWARCWPSPSPPCSPAPGPWPRSANGQRTRPGRSWLRSGYVPITGPLAASREILGELRLRIPKHSGRTKIVSDLEGRGTNCNVDPAPILNFSAKVALIKPKATDQEQLSDVGLNRGIAPRAGAVRKTLNKGEYRAVHWLCDRGRGLSGPGQ
jgi:hypothetical protein